MEFYGTVQQGRLILSDVQKQLRMQWLASIKDATNVRETLTRIAPAKTHQQVKAHFGLVVEMVRQRLIEMGVDVCGVPPNKEMVYEILKRACFGVGDIGETLGLSQMTIAQASQAFDNCRTWTATQLQLVIPDPDPNWKTAGQAK